VFVCVYVSVCLYICVSLCVCRYDMSGGGRVLVGCGVCLSVCISVCLYVSVGMICLVVAVFYWDVMCVCLSVYLCVSVCL